MKVIDLLNKIANGEITELSRFRYDDETFFEESNEEISAMKLYKSEKGYMVLDYLCGLNRLNDEVEIIEEDKKIEKITLLGEEIKLGLLSNWLKNETINEKKIASCIEANAMKINEIIDKLNKGE